MRESDGRQTRGSRLRPSGFTLQSSALLDGPVACVAADADYFDQVAGLAFLRLEGSKEVLSDRILAPVTLYVPVRGRGWPRHTATQAMPRSWLPWSPLCRGENLTE